MINRLFRAILKPFQTKNQRKNTSSKTLSAPQPSKLKENNKKTPIPDTVQRDFTKTIQNINNKLTEFTAPQPDIQLPQPIPINSAKNKYPTEILTETKDNYNPEKDAEKTIISISGKTRTELETILKQTHTAIEIDKINLSANKTKYSKLLDEHQKLIAAKNSAITAFNQEIEISTNKINKLYQTNKDISNELNKFKALILSLIDAEVSAEKHLEEIRKNLTAKTFEAEHYIESIKTVSFGDESAFHQIEENLADKTVQLDKCNTALTNNESSLSALTNSILETDKMLSEKQFELKVVETAINRIQEKEKMLAEQQLKKEAELQQARIAEETRRLEKEHRLEAEKLQTQEELQKKEELLIKQQENLQLTPETLIANEPLSEDEEVEQAKRIMEAQREKRRKAASQKQSPQTQNDVSSPIVSETIQNLSTAQPVIQPETPKENPKTLTPSEDPMVKIRAEWAKEREVKEALKAGDVDEALNLVNKPTT